MISVTTANDLSRAERLAAKAAHYASKWRALFVLAVGAVLLLMGAASGASRELQMWKAIAVGVIAWMEWEHFAFSRLLDRRDAEIRQLTSDLGRTM